MKRVIVKEQSDTVGVNSLTEQDCEHVGVVWNRGKFFLQKRIGKSHIDCLCAKDRTGRRMTNEASSFKSSVNYQIEEGHEVYIFETSKELFSWLSE